MNNLAFVSSYCFPSENNPQLGRFVLDQCLALKKKGVNIVVLNVARTTKLFTKKINIKSCCSIPVVETHIFSFALIRFPRLSIFRYKQKLKKIYQIAEKKYGKPSVIYSHFSFPVGMAMNFLSQKYSIPHVVMEHHSLYYRKKIPTIVKNNLCNLINYSNRFLCVSSSLKKNIIRHAKCDENKINVIGNIIDGCYDFVEHEKNTVFRFFAAGNLVPLKKMDVLIEAMYLLKKKGVLCILHIAGDGPERKKLDDLVKKLELSDEVLLLGRMDKLGILDEYKECDCFVLPSIFETFGIVYREAMFVGRPVISAANGGINEGWRSECGYICDPLTSETLSKTMNDMIDNYDYFNLKGISDYAKNCFSADAVADKIIDCLVKKA